MTDYKQLCAELLLALENEGYAHWTRHTPDEDELCLRARAALAEPEIPSESPTDEELRQLRREHRWPVVDSVLFAIARTVLARWGK